MDDRKPDTPADLNEQALDQVAGGVPCTMPTKGSSGGTTGGTSTGTGGGRKAGGEQLE